MADSVLVVAYFVGGTSLLGFAGFLLAGPISSIDMGFDGISMLFVDGLLCLGFFIIHSGMIRKSFRRRLVGIVPDYYHGAFYTVVSGTMLIVMMVFWQQAGPHWVSLQGGPRVLARVVFVGAIIGFWYGVRSLRSFDAFGLKPIQAYIRGTQLEEVPLSIRGAYRWVRHPLYFFALLMIWSFPDLTADRIVFNVLWTCWVVFGTYLEERDLVAEFGEAYRNYQRRVPMLVPMGAPMSKEDASPTDPIAN